MCSFFFILVYECEDMHKCDSCLIVWSFLIFGLFLFSFFFYSFNGSSDVFVGPGLNSGSTATVALLRDGIELVVASVGDSRAMLCRKGKAVKLTVDHTPERKDEKERYRCEIAACTVTFGDNRETLWIIRMSPTIARSCLLYFIVSLYCQGIHKASRSTSGITKKTQTFEDDNTKKSRNSYHFDLSSSIINYKSLFYVLCVHFTVGWNSVVLEDAFIKDDTNVSLCRSRDCFNSRHKEGIWKTLMVNISLCFCICIDLQDKKERGFYYVEQSGTAQREWQVGNDPQHRRLGFEKDGSHCGAWDQKNLGKFKNAKAGGFLRDPKNKLSVNIMIHHCFIYWYACTETVYF